MRIEKLFILVALIVFVSCGNRTQTIDKDKHQEKFSSGFETRQAINRGDIYRTTRADTAVVNLYQGNGRFGCSYGPMGLHIDPAKREFNKYGNTQYMHIQHFARAKFGADYLLPLAHIFWQSEPEAVSNYTQHQSFYDGTITTGFEEGGNKVTVTTWFDPVEKNMAGLKLDVKGDVSDIIIAPDEKLHVHYDQKLTQVSSVRFDSGMWKMGLSCLNASLMLNIKTNAEVNAEGPRLHVKLRDGENFILISVNDEPEATIEHSLSRTVNWWHQQWANSACLALPDDNAQKMWIRSMAYLLFSFDDDKLGMAPPMGFTGSGWPFPFPQDLSYIHAAMLYSGKINIAKSWIEYWTERVQGMKDYTKRLLGVKGIYAPWVFPYGKFDGYHDPLPPNDCYYEIHNSGYLARMAYETAVFVNDTSWTKKYAVPLVRETALFYRNICKKEADGLWHLFVLPSLGQDEEGGRNKKDYLCALTSAKYCFQKAIEYNLDADGFYQQVLKDGLAFSSLKSEQGIYYSNQGSGKENFGKQKHPVQLNPLAYLPVEKEVSEPTATAYKYRYEITIDSRKPFFAGWTLGEFLLAGSRMGDTEGWQKDWSNLRKSDYVDADWIQVYETSGNYGRSFYVVTNGLMVQTLLNNLVADWFGKLEIARCNPWQGKILFRNIYSLLGVKVSGQIEDNRAMLTLEAWKDCEFNLQGKRIRMKQGDIQNIQI